MEKGMDFYLSKDVFLKSLEGPSLYNIRTDELYELDEEAFDLLVRIQNNEKISFIPQDFLSFCLDENIITEKREDTRRPSLHKSPQPSLRYLELQITKKCNLRCRHCYIGEEGRGTDLSLQVIVDILEEFEDMQGLRLLVTGGEPLLHPEFRELNEIISQYALRRVLFTNGTLLDNEILKDLNFHEIQLSIDGIEDSHDIVRGKGTYRKVISLVEKVIECGFDLSVSTMVHSFNLKDFDEMERLFIKMGVKEWSVDIPCLSGNLKENKELVVSPQEGGRFLRYGFGGGIHSSREDYACGLHLASVNADGGISRCTFYQDSPHGHVKEGLRKVWERIKPMKLSELRCKCKYIDECRGGCRYRASLSGDSFSPDPYRCAMYGVKRGD